MFRIYKSQKQLPLKQKFSYKTAQEYCQLVKKSIKKQRSISKQDKKLLITSRNLLVDDSAKKSDKSNERLRHIVMRSKISQRSSSVNDRSQSKDSNKLNNICTSNNRRKLPPPQRLISRKNISTYEQMHLIVNLEEQNKKLQNAINQNELKILKIKNEIQQQRNVQQMQRQLYLLQVKKLKQTLQKQSNTRSTTRLDEEECSFGKQLSDFSQLTE